VKVDLIELLGSREIEHPSRLISAEIGGGCAKLIVQGRPWWRNGLKEPEERIVFRFEQISGGSLDLRDLPHPLQDELLETVEVARVMDLPWAQPGACHVYCQAPVPKPVALYADLQEHLLQMRAPMGARHYLNVGFGHEGALKAFIEIVSRSSFEIAKGPDQICKLIGDELTRQGVPFNVVTSPVRYDSRLYVRINQSWLFCEKATAEFD